jgi:23S rRNA (uracil1939-C5)-methyltransferase
MAGVTIPVKLHDWYEGEVIEVRYTGLGVIVVDGYEILLPNAFTGEIIRFEVTQINRAFGRGEVRDIIKPSSDRVTSDHEYLLEAGIAPYINLDYQAQLALKQEQVKKLYADQGIDVEVAPTIGMENPTHYRNKTVVPLQYQDGKLTTGFIKRRTRGEMVPLEDYFVNDPEIDRIIGLVRDVLDKHQVSVYSDETKQGDFRYIMVRRGYFSGEVMVVLVTETTEFADEAAIVADIAAAVPHVKSIVLNHNPRDLHMQLSGDNRTLWGADAIKDSLLGVEFNIGPNSFYQVNPQTTEILYDLAAKKGELSETDTVIDAYSGIGTIGLTVANRVKEVLGVEVIDRAVEDAQENMRHNHVENASFVVGDAPQTMHDWAAGGVNPDVIFVDPPRKGLTEELMDAVAEMNPDRFVYVSCNPETMARDARYLLDHGFRIKGDVQPIDQFPQTAHVESIAVFEPVK